MQFEQFSSNVGQLRKRRQNDSGSWLNVTHSHPSVDLQSRWHSSIVATQSDWIRSPWHWPFLQSCCVATLQPKGPPRHVEHGLNSRDVHLLSSWHCLLLVKNVNQPHLSLNWQSIFLFVGLKKWFSSKN